MELAVSTRPPARKKLSRFALEFSRPLRASVRSFISIHQVAAATALLLLVLILLMRAWFHCYSPGVASMNSLYRMHRKMTLTLTLTRTLPGSTWFHMPSLVLIGPAVRPAIGNRQINRHIAFLCRLAISTRPSAGVISALRASVRRIYRALRSNSLGPCGPL